MPATDVDIINLALSRVRAGRIGDRTENTPEALQADILYDLTRDHLLTLFPWRFAKKTRALSLTGNAAEEWAYEYDYPNDCLKVHYILPFGGQSTASNRYAYVPGGWNTAPIPYEVATGESGSRTILSDCESAYISYTKRVDDERLFDSIFVQAFAWLLAMDLAIPLGGDSGKAYRTTAEKGFEMSMAQAAAHSANEAEPGAQRAPRSIQARHGIMGVDYPYGDVLYRRY